MMSLQHSLLAQRRYHKLQEKAVSIHSLPLELQ